MIFLKTILWILTRDIPWKNMKKNYFLILILKIIFIFFLKHLNHSLEIIFFSEIKNKLKEMKISLVINYIDFQSHQIYLEKLIYENLDVKTKSYCFIY